MARKADRLALITDSRLSDTARVMGLYVEALGDDWQEVASNHFAAIVHGTPKSETLSRHLRQLELFGYIERKAGGRKHPDRFRWSFSPVKNHGSNQQLDPEKKPGLNGDLDPRKNTGLSDLDPEKNMGLSDRPRQKQGSKLPHTREQGPLTDVVVEDGDDDDVDPPVVPLSAAAEKAMEQHHELLAGCRGSLRDYLAQRVPATRQFGYVQTIAGWLNDAEDVWRLPDGSRLPSEKRTKRLAAALNKLAASDESKLSRPIGDPDNLRTKLEFVLKRETEDERSGRPARGAAREVGAPAPAGSGGKAADQATRRRRGFGS